MIKLFKSWFGNKEEPVVGSNLLINDSAAEILDRIKMESDVNEFETSVKERAAKVAELILTGTGFYSDNADTKVVRQHNGVISVSSAQCIYYANSYRESKYVLTGSGEVYPYLKNLFDGEVDRLMADQGYFHVDAKQIFQIDTYVHHVHPTAALSASSIGYVEFVLERDYVKEGVDLMLNGIADYKRDFEAAKRNLAKVHFADRFQPVIECLIDLYLKRIVDQAATNYNPMDRSGLLTVPLDQLFEDIGFTTELSLGRFRYTADRFEVDYYLDDQDVDFICTVHDPRAIVTFLWEALEPIVKGGKLNISAADQHDGVTRYAISVSF
ncbi:hypothetical protein TOTORO_01410 [Serratia phage vB_SmaS-Totoro]|nr:hypothetical protein TOTORO_01410 [Serratia phage vB_SmaS-Totoro]